MKLTAGVKVGDPVLCLDELQAVFGPGCLRAYKLSQTEESAFQKLAIFVPEIKTEKKLDTSHNS